MKTTNESVMRLLNPGKELLSGLFQALDNPSQCSRDCVPKPIDFSETVPSLYHRDELLAYTNNRQFDNGQHSLISRIFNLKTDV